MINPLLIKPGSSVGYGMQLEEIFALPYSRGLTMVEFLADTWDKERSEMEKAKRGRS